jgi:hypothetical protein
MKTLEEAKVKVHELFEEIFEEGHHHHDRCTSRLDSPEVSGVATRM